MAEKREHFPKCFSCEYDGRGSPCRDKDGNFLPERLAEALLLCCQVDVGTPLYEANCWAHECLDELVAEAPQRALHFIISALHYFKEDAEIAILAAGPVENLFVAHGTEVIDRVESEAAGNERFRFLLSGIWGRPHIDPKVWRRLQVAVQQGPWLDDDPRTLQGSGKRDSVE